MTAVESVILSWQNQRKTPGWFCPTQWWWRPSLWQNLPQVVPALVNIYKIDWKTLVNNIQQYCKNSKVFTTTHVCKGKNCAFLYSFPNSPYIASQFVIICDGVPIQSTRLKISESFSPADNCLKSTRGIILNLKIVENHFYSETCWKFSRALQTGGVEISL